MNNIISEVEELKELIINSDEYKDYKKYNDILEKDEEINSLIKDITILQKEIVKLKSKKIDVSIKEQELDNLYIKLNNNKNYELYIKSSKKLNELITNIQKNFQEFFDSLVC